MRDAHASQGQHGKSGIRRHKVSLWRRRRHRETLWRDVEPGDRYVHPLPTRHLSAASRPSATPEPFVYRNAALCDRYLVPFPHHPSAERRGSRSTRPVASVPFPPEPDRFRTRGRKGVSGHQGRLGVLGGLADRVFISLSIVHNCKNGYFRGAWGGWGRGSKSVYQHVVKPVHNFTQYLEKHTQTVFHGFGRDFLSQSVSASFANRDCTSAH